MEFYEVESKSTLLKNMLLFIVLNNLIDDLLFFWLPDQFISIAWHYIKRQTIKHLLKEY